jgi:beta-lactam-binding protein with PASTA domain
VRTSVERLQRQDWFFAAALAFFTGVAVWFGHSIKDFLVPTAPQLVAPTLTGQTERDAVEEAKQLRLHAVVVEREPSDSYPKDVVMSQEPKPGIAVRQGRQMSLVVSQGVQIFAMPDMRYESMREVRLDLSHYRLQAGKIRVVPNDDVPANHVVAQDPLPLTSVRVGTTVNLEISKGPPSVVRVSRFVGMSIDRARTLATRNRIHLGQIVWTPFGRYGPPHGEVVRQVPGPDSRIDAFDRVSLQVSAGPREAGYLIRQFHATVSIPESNGPKRVRVQLHDQTGTWNAFESYAQPRQKFDFNLTVVGTAELDMYVNNELLNSTTLGTEPALPPLPTDMEELQRQSEEDAAAKEFR